MGPALDPRPAATVMVVRSDSGSLEVLMLRRNLASAFVSGAHVFPGGAVDDGDGAPGMLACCSGRSDDDANRILSLDSGGLRYWVTALRECFEEAGVLVANGPEGLPLSFEDPDVAHRFVEHRRDLNTGRRSFLEICRDESLSLPADALHYVGHWITPEGRPRRYDTRFFVALAPRGQTAVHDEVETIEHMWVTPAEAVAQYERRDIELLLPTVSNLRLLARYGSTAELLEAVTRVGAVPTMRPVAPRDERSRPRAVISPDPAWTLREV